MCQCQSALHSSNRVPTLSNVLQAKRYLVFKYPSYHATLTTASQGTLVCQGGKMTQEEAAEFEELSNFQVGEEEGRGLSGLHNST